MTVARLSSFLARRPHDSSPRGVAHLLRAHRHPLHRPRRPHAALQRAPRGPSTPGHTAGRRPHQRDPRRSPYNARPSARSSRSVNPRRGRGSRGTPRTLGAPDKCAAHPHGSPQMSHAIPQHIIQTLNSDRCNSNVFKTYRKLTKGNCMRLFGGTVAPGRRGRGWPGGYAHSCGPGTPGHNTPVTRGLPGTAPPPLTRAASQASTIVRAIRRAM